MQQKVSCYETADLKKRGLKTNLEQAKYLLGFSFYAYFKANISTAHGRFFI